MRCPSSARRHAAALMAVTAAGVFRKSISALAASGFLGVGGDRGGEHQFLLQIGGEGAGELDAGRD